MADLKLYLCLINNTGELNTKVFRNLSMIRTYWQEEKRSDQVGIIHIGFIRPSVDMTQTLDKFKGTVLATASTRWSLPKNYTCSQSSVTTLSVANESIPCYLVLRGFGYQLEEQTLVDDPRTSPDHTQSTNNSITISEAALQVLNELKTPLSKEAIFGYIVERGLYQFGAKKPVSALSVQLNRYTQGTDYTHSSDTPFFGKTSDGLFYSLKALSTKPEGWLSQFSKDYHDEYTQLSSYGIFNDKEYRKQSDQLPIQLRDRSSIYKFKLLKKEIKGNNLEKILDIVPYSILHEDIKNIGFPVRVENVLISQSIETLEDLRQYSSSTILNWQNFGRKSLGDLLTTIENRVDSLLQKPILIDQKSDQIEISNLDSIQEAPDLEYMTEVTAKKTLINHFNSSIEKLSNKEQDIVRSRCAYSGKTETLEEIGNRLGVTRERIRQIQKRQITNIIDREFWDDLISIKIGQLLINRKSPLVLELLEIEDPWFKGFINNYAHLSGIIELFSDYQLRVITINDTNVISRIKIDDWNDIVSDLRHTLKEKAKENDNTRKDVDTLFISRLIEFGARELTPLLWAEFKESLFFDSEEDFANLLSYGKTAESAVRAVLIDAEKPLHYSEISIRATELFGKKIDERRAQNALMHQGAKLYGRGIYGLEKFNPIPNRMCENIILVSNHLVNNGPLMKQWHSNELLTELSVKFPNLPKELDKYILNIILSHSQELNYLNRMVWARKDSNQQINDRVDMADAFAKILEDHGSPLKGNELKERLKEIRGINAKLQLQPTDRMIQIGPDYWGLIDRDIAGSDEENNRKLDILFNHLQETQKGTHVSEVEPILVEEGFTIANEPNGYTLLNLAQRDNRFYLGRSMFLGLSEWGDDTRRLNNSQAVRKILNDMETPLSTIAISSMIIELTGLELEGSIAGLLINEGAVYDNATKNWNRASI